MANLLVYPLFHAEDENGVPLSGGKVSTFEPGTTTPKQTYSDRALTTPNTNPIILDSRGDATVWGSGAYKVELSDANDVLIWTIDEVQFANVETSISEIPVPISEGGTGATNADDALTNLGGTTVGKLVFTAPTEQDGRDALGLGTVSTLDTGTAPGEVPTNSDLGEAAFEDIQNSGSGPLLREDGDGSNLTGLFEGLVSQVSSRTTTGTWNITGLTIGKPVIIGCGTSASLQNLITFDVISGAAFGLANNTFKLHASSAGDNKTSPSATLVPTATTISLDVDTITGTTLAYQ